MPNRDDSNISSKEKDSVKYSLAMVQSIYKEFCQGKSYVGLEAYDSVEEYRSYAYGNQSSDRYINSFYGKDENDTVEETLSTETQRNMKRKAFSNLNFTIQSPAPRLMDSLTGKLTEFVNLVSVDTSDKYSGAVKESLKWGSWVDKKYKEQFNSLRALAALPQEEGEGFVPDNMEELSLYEAEGGFKLSYATAMEMLLKYSFEQSKWDDYLVEEVIKDLVTVGFTAVEDVYDSSSGQVTTEYRDAKYTGVQYSREGSYRKPEFAFTVKMVKMSDLRSKGFKEEDLKSAAEKFQNEFGNDRFEDPNTVNKNYEYGYSQQTDKYLVPVFIAYWIDVDYKNEVSHTNRYGRKRTYDYKDGAKLGKRDELLTTRIKTLRQAHWVIDTDMIYEHGRTPHQCRDGMSEPVVPIKMVKVSGKPIIPRLIPSFDLYMNSWMKFQQGIRMAALNGFAIDMAILNNINLGGKKMNPKDVLKAWRETGILFYSSENINGRQNMSNRRTIEQLPGGAGIMLTEAIDGMNFATSQIESLTGINPLSTGATPTAEAGKAVSEYSIIGTSDILKNVVRKANIIKSDAARSMCLRLQYVVKKEDKAKKAYEDVVGEANLKLLQIAEGHDVKYGIRTHARPTQEDIAELKQMLAISQKNGRDGKVGITEAEYVRFLNLVNSGESLKRVAMLLGAAERKTQKKAEERAMRAQQLDAQNAQQLNAQKSQQEQAKIAAETQSAVVQENIKGRNAILDQAVKNNQLPYEQALAIMGIQTPQQPARQEVAQEQQAQVPVEESPAPLSDEGV
ncbi:MAG: hypothetical protein KAS32_15050 [Candidatus Peribacteraceae bacterium]|nr:hypothetical protein [Candidatus Peribacteraceae bacterium]